MRKYYSFLDMIQYLTYIFRNVKGMVNSYISKINILSNKKIPSPIFIFDVCSTYSNAYQHLLRPFDDQLSLAHSFLCEDTSA